MPSQPTVPPHPTVLCKTIPEIDNKKFTVITHPKKAHLKQLIHDFLYLALVWVFILNLVEKKFLKQFNEIETKPQGTHKQEQS